MTGRGRWRAVALRAALFAALWWALAGGTGYGLPLAVLSVAAATGASLALVPPGSRQWSLRGAARFAPFFLRASFRGGVDVSLRALARPPRIRPGWVDLPLRIPAGAARVFFLNAVNLLPGTIAARVSGDIARVHVLDVDLPSVERLRVLEVYVADLFGLALDEANGPGGAARPELR